MSGKTWRADIYVNRIRQITQSSFATKIEAEKWHNHQKKLLGGKILDKDEVSLIEYSPACTFDDFCSRFEKIHLTSIRKNTQVRYLLDINYRIRPYFKKYVLHEITQMMLEDFKVSLLKNLSPKSANNCLGLAKTIFKKAFQWGFIKKNPAEYITMYKLNDVKYGWWDKKEDIIKFLEVAKKDPYYLAYRLALDCGLRLGEIIGLTKQDINLSQGYIHIHRQWLEKQKCYGATKNGKERYISLMPQSELYRLLKNAMESHSDSEMLFLSKTGKRIGGRKLSGDYFQKLIEKSGVPRIRFHDLRHTFASWYMITTDNIWDLKYLLGHADIQTTQRYAHLSSKKRYSPNFGWDQE